MVGVEEDSFERGEMKNSPAFQFYPADYLADAKVQAMSIEGEGCYIRLLCYCWREGSIPADKVAIARLCKGYDGPGIDEALKCFIPSKHFNGRFIHQRLAKEKHRQKKHSKLFKEAGLRGAEKRWGGHSQAIAKNSSSSSSSSSSSNEDSRESSIKCENFAPLFEELWKQWPSEGRFKKKYCRMKFLALCKQGKIEEFQKTSRGYSDYLKHKKENENFAQQPMFLSTFLNNWEEEGERYMGFRYEPKL